MFCVLCNNLIRSFGRYEIIGQGCVGFDSFNIKFRNNKSEQVSVLMAKVGHGILSTEG